MSTLLLPCACGCSVLAVDRWDDDDPYVYAEVYTSYTKTLRSRARWAWKSLRGKQPYCHDVLVLSHEDRERLGRFLLGEDTA